MPAARLALVLATLASLCGLGPAGSRAVGADTRGPAEALYLKLRSVGLDPARVYKIREASLDRSKLHISLDDGTIAFTEAVDGHITGAFFSGYGEVLVIPPNEMERESISLFTGSAILEETFSTAYLRFSDDVFAELKPFLRPAEDGRAFASQWDSTARTLATDDALRLMLGLSDTLAGSAPAAPAPVDPMLHAIVTGNKLGCFDLRYDSLLEEQIRVGQHKSLNGEDYYDVWTSFAVPVPASSSNPAALRDPDETPNAEFEITNFKIRAEVRPVKEFHATATLAIAARQRTRRALLFELSRMLEIREVRAGGEPVEFIHNQAVEGSHLAKQGNDLVAVILAKPLEKGQKTELTFDYAGSVLSEAANGLLYVGDRGTWYPNVGFRMASYDLEFRYPQGWTLVATGHRTQLRSAGGDEIATWVTDRPVPIAGFNLGKFSQATSRAGKVTITTYATSSVERGFPGTAAVADTPPVLPDPLKPGLPRVLALKPNPAPPSPVENLARVGTASAAAIEFYERYFGPYPYDELAITQLPGRVSQGWPGLIFLSSYSFLSPEEQSRVEPNRAERLRYEPVIAHETAHQWWGDLINWQSYRDQWIVEALANYSALMLVESHDPGRFREIMQAYRDGLLAKNEKGQVLGDAGPVTLGYRLSSSQFPAAYVPVCYGRGTWLFHMLRTMMRDSEARTAQSSSPPLSDEPFLRALRKLTRDYADKTISTPVLMRVLASELPESFEYEGRKSLDWFYESWVNGKAIPLFKLRDLKFTDRGRTTLVTGTLVAQDAPETLISAVPLYAAKAGKNVFLKRVFAEGPETQIRLSAPAGTRKLLIDPEHTLLTRAN